jgi:hypothetical protein
MLDHISLNSIRLIEPDPAYLGSLQRPEGDKAIHYMAIVWSSHISGDAMTNFSNAIEWINTKHDSSWTLLDTFDTINIGGAQIAATFGNSEGFIDPATLISLISISYLPPAFRGLLEAKFFRNTPGMFTDPRFIQQECVSYNASYHNSNYDDQPSSQGQSYVATQGGPSVSPKLYCPHCYSRTGNKYPSHGYPGKPPTG